MEIFYSAVGDKLPGRRHELPLSGSAEAWFWIVHAGSRVAEFFDDDPRANVCLANGGAIFFLSSGRYGGLESEAKALDVERAHGGRVYCLRAACTKTSTVVHDRVESFLKIVAGLNAWNPVPWQEVEPPAAHENLLALYLMLKALEFMTEQERNNVLSAWSAMPELWKKDLLDAAEQEYRHMHCDTTLKLPISPDLSLESRRKTLEVVTGF